MNLKGKQTYNTSAQQVWDILMDTEKLAKITPGVSKLEQKGEDQYNAISEIKIGPVKGVFKGDLFLQDKKEPTGFTLKVKQLSKIGNADATVHISINELETSQCELSFEGKAKLSGTLARTGQRVLTGVANSLTKQFFSALNEEIKQTTPVAKGKEAEAPEIHTLTDTTPTSKIQTKKTPETPVVNTSESSTETSTGFLAWLKQLFGIK